MPAVNLDSRGIARELSYCHSAATRSGRMMIRAMETASGRMGLIKRAQGYQREMSRGDSFWDVMMSRYGVTLDVVRGSLDNIPKTGPLVLVANHPYGILDGLVMGYILGCARPNFKILANHVFCKATELEDYILPIDFGTSKEALNTNLETRKHALSFLKDGGAIGVFPGGTVSTAVRLFGAPLDPGWRSFTARMIAKSDAVVVPVYFDGQNSRLFQIASHINSTLRMGLLLREFKKRVDSPVRVAIGEPIGRDVLGPQAGEAKTLMDFLRNKTYDLSRVYRGTTPLGLDLG